MDDDSHFTRTLGLVLLVSSSHLSGEIMDFSMRSVKMVKSKPIRAAQEAVSKGAAGRGRSLWDCLSSLLFFVLCLFLFFETGFLCRFGASPGAALGHF